MNPPRQDDDEPSGEIDPADDTIEDPLNSSAFISSVPSFKHLDDEILTLIHSSMSECEFEPGQFLMKQGDPGTSLIVVGEGEVEVIVEGAGSHHLLKRAHAGEVLGEMALLTGEPRSASVTAVSRVRAWVLPAEKFNELAARNPKIGSFLTLLLSSRLGQSRHDALTGKIFRGFRIKRRLGRGGMSVVYEAEDADSGRRVALKMMSHRLLFDPAAMRQFQAEAEIVESLDHPNIAKMYGRFEAFRTYFIVMEFCEGTSIESAIASRGRLSESVVRKLFGQLAGAIAHAHEAGIVHGDIKPSNIMVTRDGSVKLIDFGLAKRREDPSMGLFFGTPRYMSPEQMTGVPARRTSDLFALGHVTFEMLAGAPLFRSKDFRSLRNEVITCNIPDLLESIPEISSEFRDVLAGILVGAFENRALDFHRVASWAAPVEFAALESPPPGP